MKNKALIKKFTKTWNKKYSSENKTKKIVKYLFIGDERESPILGRGSPFTVLFPCLILAIFLIVYWYGR